MRRQYSLVVLIGTLALLCACGQKKVQVKAPSAPAKGSSTGPSPSSKDLEGLASYYAEPYHLRRTASGEIFDTYKDLTAAHRTLPFNTFVRVTNKANGREVDVRINDRGPFIDGRVIDLSVRAAREIDLIRTGTTAVKLTILKPSETTLSQTEAPKTGFAVQVGAFESEHAAEDLKRRLERKYSGVTIQTLSTEKTLYRVRIAQPDIDAANKLASELRKQDLMPFVVRIN